MTEPELTQDRCTLAFDDKALIVFMAATLILRAVIHSEVIKVRDGLHCDKARSMLDASMLMLSQTGLGAECEEIAESMGNTAHKWMAENRGDGWKELPEQHKAADTAEGEEWLMLPVDGRIQ